MGEWGQDTGEEGKEGTRISRATLWATQAYFPWGSWKPVKDMPQKGTM